MDIFRAQSTEGLTEIRMEYLLEDFPEMPAELSEHIRAGLPRYYAEHLGRDFFAYIAEEGEKTVGSAFLVVNEMPPNSNSSNGRTGTVLNVYVAHAYRRQGIAKALMELLISDAKALRLDFIELKASADGYPLYKKLGFKDSVSSFRPMKLIL
ncbi:MAG: GNAT family N-acetyltransferase [Ruminococcus sp.]|uniref:GNAT family N-acetyltransferase n=1 Tax=Ruminococcus sp. TaxID=41978 RepID=UPI001B1FDC20|nr:GNAT family N-acetyltransferase [Ruminococcus sp.]MBO7474631.1 GNAT family N-acetyltransferase [Ruminococcus sp.]